MQKRLDKPLDSLYNMLCRVRKEINKERIYYG